MAYAAGRTVSIFCLMPMFLCCAAVLTASPGFGGLGGLRKKMLDLKTRQPAPVRLANTSIAFTSKVASPQYTPVVESLVVALSTELISNEKSLVEKQKTTEATWVLGLTVTGFSLSQPTEYTEGSGNSTSRYKRWNGTLNAAYQVLDASGRVYDAANVSSTYNKDFPISAAGKTGRSWTIPGIPSQHKNRPGEKVPSSVEDVKQELISDVVQQIASKLGNTTKSVEVQVATGDSHLDRAAEFLEQKLWTRAVDELEKTPAFPKPEQEAYRQYDLGLAYEAISYTSAAPSDQKDNISKAAEYYDKALEMNQKEKYFVETVARTRDALARFKDLDKMAKQDKTVAIPGGTSASTSPVGTPDASARSDKPMLTTDPNQSSGKMLKIEDVIKMYKSGIASEQILEAIQQRPVQFDPFDTDTMVAIRGANLPAKIQNALRAKVGAPLIKPVSTPKSSTGKTL